MSQYQAYTKIITVYTYIFMFLHFVNQIIRILWPINVHTQY